MPEQPVIPILMGWFKKAFYCALGIGAALGTGYLLLQNEASQHPAADTAAHYESDAETKVARCRLGPEPQRVACEDEARDTAREKQREHYELEVSARNAWWAKVVALCGIVALFLSAVGAWFIYRAFRETRAQTADVQETLLQGKRYAEAMEAMATSFSRTAQLSKGMADFQEVAFRNAQRARLSPDQRSCLSDRQVRLRSDSRLVERWGD